MCKTLPAWLFLLCVLLGILFTVIFGWCVESTVEGDTRFGKLGEASLTVASFPDLARNTITNIGAAPDAPFRLPRPNVELAKFRPLQMRSNIHVQGLMLRADKAALMRASGWRLLVGDFVIDGQLQYAALVLSPELEAVKVWVISDEEIPGKTPPPENEGSFHGFAILKDGSMIFAFDYASIQRVDRCGRRIWFHAGEFSHTVGMEDDEKFFWTVNGAYSEKMEVVRVATSTGEVVRRVSMADIIAANPTIDILEIGKDDDWNDGHPGNTKEKWTSDPFHLNDVEPLPANIADRFTGFKAGDLLISSRSLNLLFVLDPQTLKVEWWQSGTWRRQHDPDWQPTGEITVLDNRRGRGYSRIVSIDPASRDIKVLFDGRTKGFYTEIMGKHQITSIGNILITSPMQGRVFEVDTNGHIVFDLFNTKPSSKEFNYLISEAMWLPLDSFDFTKDFSCEP